jgi:hypothetical protein
VGQEPGHEIGQIARNQTFRKSRTGGTTMDVSGQAGRLKRWHTSGHERADHTGQDIPRARRGQPG